MLRLRTLSTIKRTISDYFVLWPQLRAHDISNSKLYIYKTLRYSAHNDHRNEALPNLRETNNIQRDEEHIDFISDIKDSDVQKLKEDVSKESRNVTSFCGSSIYTNNSNNYEDIQHLYPQPITTVHNIYTIVQNEFKQQVLDIKYKQETNNQWMTCISVTWPSYMEFNGIGRSKNKSRTVAALKCLTWLHNNNRLQNGKPILYTKEEIKQLLNIPVKIDVSYHLVEKMQNLIIKYRMDIADIIENSDLEVNIPFRDMREDKNDCDTVPFWAESGRNEVLRKKLLSRKSKKYDLPIFDYRDEILKKLQTNQVLLIKGDTGCGKTTQVPQFIMDDYTRKGNATSCTIGISQPRRVSAISLAERIAFERNEKVGDVVGYHVRLDTNVPRIPGQICFYTTGVLRRKLQYDPSLNGYSHIILDEAHERSIDIDILLVLLKRALQHNSSLKLIIMSATINADLFQRYFNCPVVEVPGKMYPVQQYFLNDFSNVVFPAHKLSLINEIDRLPVIDCYAIKELVMWIDKNKPSGAILCFLPGWREIAEVRKLLQADSSSQSLYIVPVHSKMLNIEQRNIFKSAPSGKRKVVLATDIAETGITITDIVYVVDSALKKNTAWSNDGMCHLRTSWIAQANLNQRKGRAGRVQAGESYHFITKEQYKILEPYPVPEILSTSLEKTVLDSKTFSEDTESFLESLIQPPSSSAVWSAVDTLIKLGALDQEENLTPLGKRMACIPMTPRLAKALIYAPIFQCLYPIMSIVSIYGCTSQIFTKEPNDNVEVREIKQNLSKHSDHLAMLQAFSKWREQDRKKYQEEHFCNSMHLSSSTLRLVNKLCKVHTNNLIESGILDTGTVGAYRSSLINKYANESELICGIIYAATNHLLHLQNYHYKNGIFQSCRTLKSEDNTHVTIRNSSVNYKKTDDWPSPYLTHFFRVYNDELHGLEVRESSVITPLTVLLFSQARIYIKEKPTDKMITNEFDEEMVTLCIEGMANVTLTCEKKIAETLISFHHVIWSTVNYFVRHGTEIPKDDLFRVRYFKEEVVDTIIEMINIVETDDE